MNSTNVQAQVGELSEWIGNCKKQQWLVSKVTAMERESSLNRMMVKRKEMEKLIDRNDVGILACGFFVWLLLVFFLFDFYCLSFRLIYDNLISTDGILHDIDWVECTLLADCIQHFPLHEHFQ